MDTRHCHAMARFSGQDEPDPDDVPQGSGDTTYEYRAARAVLSWRTTATGHRTSWYDRKLDAIQAAQGYDWREFWIERRTKAGAIERVPQ